MSTCERPKSAWKSRSRTPHYTTWEGEPEGGRHVSREPPRPTSDRTTAVRPHAVLLTDAASSLSDRPHHAAEASRERKAGRQRNAPEISTKSSAEADDNENAMTNENARAKKNGRQRKKLIKKLEEDASQTTTQEEHSRRSSTSESYAEDIRRLPISPQKREKSWCAAGDTWPKHDRFCDVRITSKEVRGGVGAGGDGGGAGRGGGGRGGSRGPYITAKPSKLAPLNLTRPSEGLAIQETKDAMPRSWMPERGADNGLISAVFIGKRSDANPRNKFTPLPGLLRKCVDAEKRDDHPCNDD